MNKPKNKNEKQKEGGGVNFSKLIINVPTIKSQNH
jgi:hypothetical protein